MSKSRDRSEKFESCARRCLYGDVRILQMMGLYSMGRVFKHKQQRWYYWEVIPFIIGLGVLSFGVSFNIRNIFASIKTDVMLAIEAFAATVSSIMSMAKGFRIWMYRHELYELIYNCHKRWCYHASRKGITEDMVRTVENVRSFRRFYAVAVGLALWSYGFRPYALYLKFYLSHSNSTFDFARNTVYPAKYPFPLNSQKYFFLCTFYENIGIYFLNVFWLVGDTLFPQLATHISIQFKILANDIRNLHVVKATPAVNDDKTALELKRIVKDYLTLFSYVSLVEEFYNPIIFVTVLSNGINICSVIYSMQSRLNSDSNWGDVEKNISHGVVLLSQTFMYCNYAQRLSDETVGIRQALYDSRWIEFNKNAKVMVIIMMMRTQREFVYTAYNLIKVNTPQMTAIVTTAMRLLALLRNVL